LIGLQIKLKYFSAKEEKEKTGKNGGRDTWKNSAKIGGSPESELG
jgi:hypothetical protein